MGTRADFYIGRGKDAQWLGSVAWDGYPGGLPKEILSAKTQEDFIERLAMEARSREDFTSSDMGWPWPWNDSGTTDYAYAFDGGQVWASGFGGEWFKADGDEPEREDVGKEAVFPDMSKRKSVTFGNHSGLLVVGTQ